ncbi:MAG: hypothetical protein FWG37_00460 [Clostridia bacterium]|nr:hypothetical protein [Clostridia bacterium]
MTSETRKRYEAFWARDYDTRAVLWIEVPSKAAYLEPPSDMTERWENMEYRIKACRQYMQNTRYFAEAIPGTWINFGPGVMAAMLGGDYAYFPDTVWFGRSPIMKDWRDMDSIHISRDNRMHRFVLEATERILRDSAGTYRVGMTDLGGAMDILASLRGTEPLLTDLLDAPEEVEKATKKLDDLWETTYSEFYALNNAMGQHGMTTWMPIWCPKRWYPLQCDFSAMISPDHFRRFVLPSVDRGARFLDHSVYHLDGVGELPHLDMLLSIDRLDAIQWVPGDGKPGCGDEGWFPVYEKIQSRGKGLVLMGVNSSVEMLRLLKQFSHKGLCIFGTLSCAEEAEEVVRKAAEYAS